MKISNFHNLAIFFGQFQEEYGKFGQAVVAARREDLAKLGQAEEKIESLRGALEETQQRLAEVQGPSSEQKNSEQFLA